MPHNTSLLKLPPYSPELNPVENIWQFLRQNQLSNRVFANYDAIVDACCDAWNALTAEAESDQSQPNPGQRSMSDAVGITFNNPWNMNLSLWRCDRGA